MINLVKDTIDNNDIDKLVEWLKKYPRLTKGKLTEQFEQEWSKYVGCKYSVFVNSGSSANLAMFYVVNLMLKNKGIVSNNRIIIPAVSWATDLAPAIQLGFEPYLCDASKDYLGVDLDHFERICKENHCKVAVVVHVLGIPAQMNEIRQICNKYDIILLEDSCESIGSTLNGIKTGNFGVMSTFSFYFGHHMSTIEGGMICTNDKDVYDLLKMIRSHGWDRDLDSDKQQELRNKYNVNEFNSMYTFYVPGFNIRSTDLQAFLGIEQIKKLDKNNDMRFQNFKVYQSKINNDYWKIKAPENEIISNFAYPIIHPNRDKIAQLLIKNGIECRPLICGSLLNQPVFDQLKMEDWKKQYIKKSLPFADVIHKFGMYIPNHPSLTFEEINFICDIVNNGF